MDNNRPKILSSWITSCSFDLESAFVFPWAAIFREVAQVAPGFILTEMFFFLGILILGYIYAWKKGALKWQ